MLVTSIFSFCHHVFYHSPNQFSIFQSHLFCCLQNFSIWNSLKFCHLVKSWAFSFILPSNSTLTYKTCEKIVWKGEDACNQHFLPFTKQFCDFNTLTNKTFENTDSKKKKNAKMPITSFFTFPTMFSTLSTKNSLSLRCVYECFQSGRLWYFFLCKPIELTLNSTDIHFDTSTTDNSWKHCGKRRNCL